MTDMTTYRIWRDGSGAHEPGERTSWSPGGAAIAQAEHDFAHHTGWGWLWPVTYFVEDAATGHRWRIEVDSCAARALGVTRAGRAAEVRQ